MHHKQKGKAQFYKFVFLTNQDEAKLSLIQRPSLQLTPAPYSWNHTKLQPTSLVIGQVWSKKKIQFPCQFLIEMAQNLCLPCFLILFVALNLQSTLSWNIQNSTDDQCPPQPHPLGMCKARVAAYGYPCEEYQVTTDDGYILSLKRIPHGLSDAGNSTERTPVLLFHGLLVVRTLLNITHGI